MKSLHTRFSLVANCAKFVASPLLFSCLLPSIALAQSTLSGVVRDSSGAVVANATVEAGSDVLIERTRKVNTNAEGRYAIVDLRPGTYTVTVSSAGFITVKQTIVVPANITVPVDAELKVGSVAETVSVEARVATVDVENVAHPETLTRAEMDALPSGRYMQSIGSYVPGAHLNLPDIGGSQQIEQNYISLHGNGSTHDVYMMDGMLVNTTYDDGRIQQYIDNAAIQETTYQTSNVTAEASGGGMFTNLIPKDGGNQFHGSVFGGGSGGSNFWQGDNLDRNLLARGLTAQDKTVKIEDFDGSLGGPIKTDKLWFLLTGRRQVTFTQAGASTYPDGRPGIQDGYIYAGSLRLTYQVNAKNKFSASWMRNWKYKAHEILDGGQEGFIPADPSVAATQRNKWPMYYILQTRWTGTLTPKLLAEAGITISHLDYNDLYQAGIAEAPSTQAWYAKTTARDTGTLRRYFAGRNNQYFQTSRTFFTGSLSYITGSHQIKAGVQDSFGPYHTSVNQNGDGYSVFTNGVPVNFVAINTPYYQWPRLDADLGIYATDTWHFKRLAITAGIRWEYLAAEIEAENAPAGRFVPARSVPKTDCSTIKGMGCWKDWAPRLGVVYDVFGNHKLAVKAGFGKYNSQYSTGFTNNFNPMTAVTQNVAWSFPDPKAPGSPCAPVTFAGVPSPNPNCYPTGSFNGVGALPAAGAGTLGPSINPAFGSVAAGTGVSLDPNWHRDYNYQYNAGIQQEIAKGVTLNVNWYRRSQYQQTLVLNSAVPFSAWSPVTITNPLDGSPITVYNLSKPAPSPVLRQTNAPQSLVRNVYTGYEASILARMPRGIFGVFGWTIDRDLDRYCDQSAGSSTYITCNKLNDPNSLRYCDMFGELYQDLGKVGSLPWQNEFKAQGSIPIRWGFVGSLSFYSNRYQGTSGNTYYYSPLQVLQGTTVGIVNDGYLARTWTITSTTRYPANCVGCTPGALVDPGLLQGAETIYLVPPGKVLTPRLNQLDLGLKKVFTFRDRFVIEPQAQVFNVLNSNAAVTQAVALGNDTSPFLPKSACGSSSPANCGLGGAVTTITNPRLLRVALLVRF